ncbi:DDE superfamily endonuclease [Popillia japonica]|uniref:DDE superfamily endonuclease n=1 Tax=Popillia japonica TaxID=7064 RepID=A0AAW1HXX4_POPJA
MISGAPSETLGLVSTSGWMTSELFPSVMRHFISHSNSSKDNPSVLIYDNHESHLTIETLNLAKDNGVTIVTLPPHCSNKLQPLDVSVFYSFRSHYNAQVDSWLLHNPGTPMTIYEVASCVGVAHERAMTPANIISVFEKTGIYPFDRNVFSDDDFLISYVTDRDLPTKANVAMPMKHIGTEKRAREEESRTGSPKENTLTASVSQASSSGSNPKSNNLFISSEQYKGFPKARARKSKTSRAKGRSCIATDTPEKSFFEAKEAEKQRNIFFKEKFALT